jgi:hypothetical protein
MEILLNNQPKQIAAQQSVQQLLNEVVGEKQKGIAVATITLLFRKRYGRSVLLPKVIIF